MKIVIAPDSFKESLSAWQVATLLADGIRAVIPTVKCELVPMADGGEGTVDALVTATHGRVIDAEVTGPLGDRVTARFGLLGNARCAVVEMAAASGLMLVPAASRDPCRTTSFGTGQLIRKALAQQVDTLIVAIGGSATVDGGAGMLQALGVKFFGHDDYEITAPLTGGTLSNIARIDTQHLDVRLASTRTLVACDVDNPLLGPQGAAAVFGPQKGATPAQVAELEAGLAHFYGVVARTLGHDVAAHAGAGAAGGMGAALLSFARATLRPGIDLVIEATALAAHLQHASLVITGEGRLDAQTLRGKTPCGVAALARRHGIPVIAVGGSTSPDAERELAGVFDAIETAVTYPISLADALTTAAISVERMGRRIGHWLQLSSRLRS
jgi:glycerate 2-kinase